MASPEEPTRLTVRSAKVRNASRLATRSCRSDKQEFLAEGPQAVREALGRPEVVLEVFATLDATDRHPDLSAGAAAGDIAWHVVDETVVKTICDTVHPQGLVARCRFVDVSLDDIVAAELRLVVVCVDIRDPGNAGTVIRCADAAGADAVIFAGNSVDPFNPKAVRASAGSVFHVPIVLATDTSTVVDTLHAKGMQVFAADGQGNLDLFADDDRLVAPTVWLLGNEAWGLRGETRALADEVVSVPIFGEAESLNLATAAAVCLYASARAQRIR